MALSDEIDEEKKSFHQRWQLFKERLNIPLIIYLITGALHLLLLIAVSIVLLVQVGLCNSKPEKEHNECKKDTHVYIAYAPILLVSGIIFEGYNILGVWNANIVQMISFICGSAFILFFAIFRCFISNVQTFWDSYFLFGYTCLALVVYIVCAIISYKHFTWTHYYQAPTEGKLQLMKIGHVLTPVTHFAGLATVCLLFFCLAFGQNGSVIFILDIVVLSLTIVWGLAFTFFHYLDRVCGTMVSLCCGVLPFAYILFRFVNTWQERKTKYLNLPLHVFSILFGLDMVLYVAMCVFAIIYFCKYLQVRKYDAEDSYSQA